MLSLISTAEDLTPDGEDIHGIFYFKLYKKHNELYLGWKIKKEQNL